MTGPNNLAYYDTTTIMAVESLIVQAHGWCVLKKITYFASGVIYQHKRLIKFTAGANSLKLFTALIYEFS